MNRNLKTISALLSSAVVAGAIVAVSAPDAAHAQTSRRTAKSNKAAKPAKQTRYVFRRVNPSGKRVTMELQNASVRQALTQLFRESGADFSLDNGIAGNVTLKVTDQPFDRALQLMLQGSSQPLTYEVENGTYFIKPAPVASSVGATSRVAQTAPVEESPATTTTPEPTAPTLADAQPIGPNSVFAPQTFQVGNNVVLSGGFGGYDGFSGYSGFGYTGGNTIVQSGSFAPNGFAGGYSGFGGYNGFNGFGGQVVTPFNTSGAYVPGPGFYNPATGIGAYYGYPGGGFNVYSGSNIFFGF